MKKIHNPDFNIIGEAALSLVVMKQAINSENLISKLEEMALLEQETSRFNVIIDARYWLEATITSEPEEPPKCYWMHHCDNNKPH